jgi:hypothetical protein
MENQIIDIEDWQDSDDSKKRRLLNVAERVLGETYPDYTIPHEAIFEFSAVLAVFFNDTNKMQQYGVASFGITGVASFTFKQGETNDIYDLIPRTAKELIGKANDVKLTGKVVTDTVL